MARILLGVSGGIAAYKALELVRLATAAGHVVRVVQTPTSRRFVGEASFVALTGAPVLTSEFERDPARGAFPGQPEPTHDPASHLALVAHADVYLIAPASANTLAKLAHGLADGLVTSAALAARCPVIVAPAMNDTMWEHPATRANVALLADRGTQVIAPGTGRLATHGEHGTGRLPDPAELLAAVEAALGGGPASGTWDGLEVLVTAGGTREPIDAVRYVGNRSSGRMGIALADAAAARGARVTLVAANVALASDPRVERLDVATAAELQAACEGRFAQADVLLMAAAIADFRPASPADHKLKKDGRDELVVVLEPTSDVLMGLAADRRPGQVLVGFAAETGPADEQVAHARAKLDRKNLDAVVLNDVGAPGIGFDAPENAVTIVTADAQRAVARSAKTEVAQAVLDAVDGMRALQVATGVAS